MSRWRTKMLTYTPFMKFWAAMNAVLKSHGLPEMLFGEARGYWKDSQ